MFELEIQRFGPATHRPHAGSRSLHRLCGNAVTLLSWLETQLGVPARVDRPLERVQAYLLATRRVSLELCRGSLETDAWTTAAVMLERRDELRLAGWDGAGSPKLPAIVNDLARVEASAAELPRGEAERVVDVLAALDSGQNLPPYRLQLHDPVVEWPQRWQQLLAKLEYTVSTDPPAALPEREVVATRTASGTIACRAVVAELRRRQPDLGSTVICCEDPALQVQLDEALVAVGLPSPGVTTRLGEQPALQVLPLILELCWEPVDPQLLLDFLTLPISPLPTTAAWRLADALTEEPGLGSRSWERALSRIRDKNSQGVRDAARIAEWLDLERVPRVGDENSAHGLPTALVVERAQRVAEWAIRRARALARAGEQEGFREGLFLAAQQAQLLAELAELEEDAISSAHLNHLLRAVRESVPQRPLRSAGAGAPTILSSLGAIASDFERCIWLGTSTGDVPPGNWTSAERAALATVGVQVDDGTATLAQRRRAERRGLQRVRGTVLGITLPHDEEQRPHPMWQQLASCCTASVSVERALTQKAPPAPFAGASSDLTVPFRVPFRRMAAPPLQSTPAVWSLDPTLLMERDYSSATELQARLACPLQWVLNYQARLRTGSSARVPSSFLLKGRFCHAVLEEVLQGGGPLPDPQSAVAAVERVFDERLPLDAAPLAQPAASGERTELRRQLAQSTRVLIEALALGGYRITQMESEFNGKISGRTLKGYIDCLAEDADGNEAVIDFKYGGAAKYRKLLREGRAVQLAIYAGARHAERGGAYPQVAYLIISDHAVHTPAGNPIAGASATSLVRGAPDLAEVWRNFQLALECADTWLQSGEIPVRPLQELSDWPLGANLVLTEAPRHRVEQDICRYCDYRSLCGIEEAR